MSHAPQVVGGSGPSVRRLILVTLAAAVMVAGGTGIFEVVQHSPGYASDPTPAPVVATALTEHVAFPTSVRHVITVLLENENAGNALAKGPFERHLIARYGYASNYYAICHPSAPNYLGITSGESDQCGSDKYNKYSTTNIADLVESAGLTWGSYAESIPSPCYHSNSGEYVVRHVPLLFYNDIVSNSTRCDSHIVGFSAWNSSVSSGTIPNYAFITPNLLDDGHDTNVSYADHWLKGWLSPLLNDSFFRSSVFFIVYDESGGTTSGYHGLDGGRVFFAAVGPDVIKNSTYSADSSHYNLLETTEWLLGLGNTGHNDSSSSFPPLESLFKDSNSTPIEYNLEGRVTAASTGDPISGANVSVAGGPSTTTNSSGAYQLALANGSYSVNASAAGFVPATQTVVILGSDAVRNFSLTATTVATYSVSGTVSNRSDGAPLSGAQVTISGGGSFLTNSTGEYATTLPNGTFTLTASDPGYGPVASSATVAGHPVSLNFTLSPESLRAYSISGRVTYASNQSPAAGVTVELSSTGSEVTGINGSYLFSAVNGSYNLTIRKAGFSPQSLIVPVQGASVIEDFVLAPPVFPLAGVVSSQITGLPLPGANVSLSGASWQATGQDGRFSFLVPNGTYELEIKASGYTSWTQKVTVAGEPVSLNLSVSLATTPSGSNPAPPALPVEPWEVLGAVVALLVVVGLLLVIRRRRTRRTPRAARSRRPVR
jgi:phosphoesterase family protein/carboxypeptidase family protein